MRTKPICHGWKDGVLTYKIKGDTVEIAGVEEYNNWERARLNGGEWISADGLFSLGQVYQRLGGMSLLTVAGVNKYAT